MDKQQAREINRRYRDVFNKHYGAYRKRLGLTYSEPLLCHANTVRTATSFLEQSELVSRQEMENRGFDQTPQDSDALDKKLGIYNDIFFDSIDICDWIGSRNQYGPVLFCFHMDLLNDLSVPIKITKTNPYSSKPEENWNNNTSEAGRYFSSPEEYDESFNSGSFGSFGCHVTIPNCTSIPLDRLAFILVDAPEVLADSNADYVKHIRALAKKVNKMVAIRNFEDNGLHFGDTELHRERFEKSYAELDLESLKKCFCQKDQTLIKRPGGIIQFVSREAG